MKSENIIKSPDEINLEKIKIEKSYRINVINEITRQPNTLILNISNKLNIIINIKTFVKFYMIILTIIIISDYCKSIIQFAIMTTLCFAMNKIIDKTTDVTINKNLTMTIGYTLILVKIIFIKQYFIQQIQKEYFHIIIIIHLIAYTIITSMKDAIIPDVIPNVMFKFDIYKTKCKRYGVVLYSPEYVEEKDKKTCSILFNTTNVPAKTESQTIKQYTEEIQKHIHGMYLDHLLYTQEDMMCEAQSTAYLIECMNLIQSSMNYNEIYPGISNFISDIYTSLILGLYDGNSKALRRSSCSNIFGKIFGNQDINKQFIAFEQKKKNLVIVSDIKIDLYAIQTENIRSHEEQKAKAEKQSESK